MIRAAVYARYSSELQNARSVEDQVEFCRRYAEREGLEIVRVYADRAVSGYGEEKREEYRRLVADALSSAPGWTVLLVEDLSRLGRSLHDLLRLIERLRFRGLEVFSISDGIRTSGSGAAAKATVTVRGLVADLYLEDLREKTHRGMAAAFRRGFSPGGRVFGYRLVRAEDGTRLEVDPAEAEVVRGIFAAYVGGASHRRVAHDLNARVVPPPAASARERAVARTWGASTVAWILRNERYIGRIAWNRREWRKDPDTGRRIPRARTGADLIVREDESLRIVPDELWRAVANRRAVLQTRYGDGSRVVAGRAASSDYLLTGLARCGLCGARMTGHASGPTRSGRARWYRCPAFRDRGTCTNASLYDRDALEGLVTAELVAATTTLVPELVSRANALLKASRGGVAERADALEIEISRRDLEARRLAKAIADGLDSETVRSALREAEDALRALRGEIQAIRSTPATLPAIREDFVRRKLQSVVALLRSDRRRGKAALALQVDGEIRVLPRPSAVGEVRARIEGRWSVEGLLGGEALARTGHCGGAIRSGDATPVAIAWSADFLAPSTRRPRR